MNRLSRYASLVKFSHTLFALPFALASYVYALTHTGTPFEWLLLVKILLCMVFARNAAMGFNRWADRKIDAANPRTAGREIPAGHISARGAIVFVVANAAAFVATAWWINPLALMLSPVALLIILGYSYTKRFTPLSHIVLGTALAIAPIGAYIAVTGSVAVVPVLLAGIVITWVSGFDVLYALQDAHHDRTQGLHSIPAKLGGRGATTVSILLHAATLYGVVLLGKYREFGGGTLYWVGAGLFIGLLVAQHAAFRPSKIETIGRAFGLLNGISSLTFAAFMIADMLW